MQHKHPNTWLLFAAAGWIGCTASGDKDGGSTDPSTTGTLDDGASGTDDATGSAGDDDAGSDDGGDDGGDDAGTTDTADGGDESGDDGDGGGDAGGDDGGGEAGDDGGTVSFNGTVPASPAALPEFAATNSDGSGRAREDLLGHPTVMWFYPAAATAG